MNPFKAIAVVTALFFIVGSVFLFLLWKNEKNDVYENDQTQNIQNEGAVKNNNDTVGKKQSVTDKTESNNQSVINSNPASEAQKVEAKKAQEKLEAIVTEAKDRPYAQSEIDYILNPPKTAEPEIKDVYIEEIPTP